MAVTLQAPDLLQPDGELGPDLFPDGSLEVKVANALVDAIAVVEGNAAIAAAQHNDAARAWVHARIYRMVATRLAAQPSTAMVGGQFTRSVGQDRVAYFNALAAAEEAKFAAYATPATVLDRANRSQATAVRGVW